MRPLPLPMIALLVSQLLVTPASTRSADPKPPTKTIKQLMRQGFQRPESPGYRAMKGQATTAELKQLSKITAELARLTPPKGSATKWTSRTSELLTAVKDGVEQNDGAVERIRVAIRCVTCHRDHRPTNSPHK